jgi:hypothetical protein
MTTIAPHLSVEELGARNGTATDVRWLNRLIARYNARSPESRGDQRAHNGTEATSSLRRFWASWPGTWRSRRSTAVCGRDRRLPR